MERIFFLLGIISIITGLTVCTGATAVLLTTFGACSFNVIALSVVQRVDKEGVAYKLLMLFWVIEGFLFLVLAALYPSQLEAQCATTNLFEKAPVSLLGSFCLVPATGVVMAWLRAQVARRGKPREGWTGMIIRPSRLLDGALVLTMLANLSVWPATAFEDNALYYAFRVLHRLLLGVTVLAGYRFRVNPSMTAAWILSLVLGIILAMGTGAREYGFLPAGLYMAGVVIYGWQHRSARLWLVFMMLCSLPLIFTMSSVTENVRTASGRKSISETDVTEVLDRVRAIAYGVQVSDDIRDPGTVDASPPLYRGMSRFVYWTDVMVPAMAGDPVKYRGFSDWRLEMLDLFQLKLWGSSDRERYFGGIYANDYGFSVFPGISTVPFSILADGWSRGGCLVALLYALVATVTLIMMEELSRFALGQRTEVVCIVFGIIGGTAFNYYSVYPLLSSIRETVLVTGLSVICGGVVTIMTGRGGQPKKAVGAKACHSKGAATVSLCGQQGMPGGLGSESEPRPRSV